WPPTATTRLAARTLRIPRMNGKCDERDRQEVRTLTIGRVSIGLSPPWAFLHTHAGGEGSVDTCQDARNSQNVSVHQPPTRQTFAGVGSFFRGLGGGFDSEPMRHTDDKRPTHCLSFVMPVFSRALRYTGGKPFG